MAIQITPSMAKWMLTREGKKSQCNGMQIFMVLQDSLI